RDCPLRSLARRESRGHGGSWNTSGQVWPTQNRAMRKANPTRKPSADPARTPKAFDILVCGATALTAEPDQPIIEECVVGICGDRIALLASAAEAGAITADHIIDARGHVLTPGFINIHTHAVLA